MQNKQNMQNIHNMQNMKIWKNMRIIQYRQIIQNLQKNMQNISPLFFWSKDQKSKISESRINSRTCLGHLVLFELSLVLLTTKALGLYEFWPKVPILGPKKNGTSSGQIKILRPLL